MQLIKQVQYVFKRCSLNFNKIALNPPNSKLYVFQRTVFKMCMKKGTGANSIAMNMLEIKFFSVHIQHLSVSTPSKCPR